MNASRDELFARALGRRAFLRGAATLTAAGAAAVAVACGDGGDSRPEGTATVAPDGTPGMGGTPAAGGRISPRLLTREFVLNENNRFLVGLLDDKGGFVENAKVELRFYKIGSDGMTGSFRRGGEASFLKLSLESHPDEQVPFYGVVAPFDEPGSWGVEIIVTPADGSAGAQVQIPFDVLEQYETPANGQMAPKSVNDTVETTANRESLCSRNPQCDLHDRVIADLVGAGRPFVVQFSTPAFCETRFCGPVLDVVLDKVDEYRDRVDFVHIEVWQDFQTRIARPAIGEWNLPTEPYTFFVRGDGTVAGRLESIFTTQELVEHLDALLRS